MRGARWWVAAWIWALPLAGAAQTPAVTLHWEPDAEVEGCPEAEAVLEAIETTLPNSATSSESVVVHAHISTSDHGLRLDLWAQRGPHAGRRELEARSCEPLAEAVTLIVALLVSPETSVAPLVEPAPDGEAERADEPDPTPSLPTNPYLIQQITSYDSGWIAGDDEVLPNPFRAVEIAREVHTAVALEAGLSVGALPEPTAILGIRVEVCVDAYCPWLEASFLLPSEALVTSGSQAGADFWQFATRFGYRHRVARRWWEVGPIGSLDVGVVNASSHDVAEPATSQTAWLSLSAGAFFGGGSERLTARVETEAMIPLLRPEYVIEGIGSIFRSSPIALVASLVLELRIR